MERIEDRLEPERPITHKHTLAALALFFGIILLVFRGYFLYGETFIPTDYLKYYPPFGKLDYDAEAREIRNSNSSDILNYVYPNDVIYSHWIKRGEIPYWNPYVLCGHPQHGTGQTAMLYPLKMLIFYALPYPDSYMVYLAIHFLMCALTMYFFLKYLGLGYSACIAGSLLWMLNGLSAMFLPAENLIVSFAYLPLVVHLFYRGISEGKLWLSLLAGAISGISFLGGYPPVFIWQFLILLAIAVFCGVKYGIPGKQMVKHYSGFGCVAVLVSLPQLFYFVQALLLSDRGEIGAGYALPVTHKILGFFVHTFFPRLIGGSLDDFHIVESNVYFQEFQFVGILAVVLTFVALGPKGFHNGLRIALFAILLFNVLLNKTPLSNLLFKLPVISALSGLKMVGFTFAVSVLAAMGLDKTCRYQITFGKTARLLLVCGILLLLVAVASLAVDQLPRMLRFDRPHIYLTVFALFINGSVLLLKPYSWRPAAIVAVMAIDLLVFVNAYDITYSRQFLRGELATMDGSRTSVSYQTKYWGFPLETTLVPEGRMLANGYDAFHLKRTVDVLAAEMGFRRGGNFILPDASRRKEQSKAGVEDCFIADEAGNIKEENYYASATPLALLGEISHFSPTEVEIAVSDRYDTLTYLDSHYPGWECTIDGKPAEITLAMGAFKSVQVPKGSQIVKFRFVPTGLPVIVAIAVVTLIAVIVISIRGAP